MEGNRITPQSVGGVIAETFVQYRTVFRFWLIASACVLIPYLVLESIFDYSSLQNLNDVMNKLLAATQQGNAMTALGQSFGSIAMLFAMSLINMLIVSPLLYGTLLHHLTERKLNHREATLDESFSHAARRLFAVDLTNIVWWVLIAVGLGVVSGLMSALLSVMGRAGVFVGIAFFLALFCFCIWVIVKSSFASSAVFEEGRWILGAVRHSFQLTKRMFWRTFGFYLLLFVMVAFVQFMLSLIINGLAGNTVLSVILLGIVTLFVTPFEMIGRANIYLDSRIRMDGRR